MKASVLVAGPGAVARKIASALGDGFTIEIVSDVDRAAAVIELGVYPAIVVARGFLSEPVPAGVIVQGTDDAELVARVTAAVTARRREAPEQGRALSKLAAVGYDEYMQLVRTRETRRYLLALLHRHQGSVTAAARAAGIVRESLHRLLRRHDLDADAFRGKPD